MIQSQMTSLDEGQLTNSLKGPKDPPSPAHQGTLNPTLRTATVKKNQFLWHVIGEIECRIRLACNTLGNHWRSKWGEAQKNLICREIAFPLDGGWIGGGRNGLGGPARVYPLYLDYDVTRRPPHIRTLTPWGFVPRILTVMWWDSVSTFVSWLCGITGQ